MKLWFKYEYGFVNIDKENLYLTNTGNWTETQHLEEKTSSSIRKSEFRKTRIGLFLILAILGLIFIFYKQILHTGFSLIGLGALFFAGYKLYQYLQRDLGSAFKIPISKIESIDVENKNVVIHFLDGNNESNLHKLINIEEKGINIIKELRET